MLIQNLLHQFLQFHNSNFLLCYSFVNILIQILKMSRNYSNFFVNNLCKNEFYKDNPH
nr:MAG TPA: hypothetical protein [Caudoviricetes sp.]